MCNRKETLADRIEQFMFERGEYDFGKADRIRWLDNIPDAYNLAEDRECLNKAREIVTARVFEELDNRNPEKLTEYFNSQLVEMDEDDELIGVAKNILLILSGE